MTLMKRVVACLDVRGTRVVKGTEFVDLRDVGDPASLAVQYERDGADEIVFLDIGATIEQRATMLDLAQRTARRLFIPLTIGGGIRSADDIAAALRAGADKVAVNSAGVARPQLYTEGARRFGAQCVVASIDARREADGWRVYTASGRTATGLDAIEWAREVVRRGAGEILLTSVDRDGSRNGYDVALTRAVADAVNVPVVASGGAGTPQHIADALGDARADAALVAGILHDRMTTVRDIKAHLRARGLDIRSAA